MSTKTKNDWEIDPLDSVEKILNLTEKERASISDEELAVLGAENCDCPNLIQLIVGGGADPLEIENCGVLDNESSPLFKNILMAKILLEKDQVTSDTLRAGIIMSLPEGPLDASYSQMILESLNPINDYMVFLTLTHGGHAALLTEAQQEFINSIKQPVVGDNGNTAAKTNSR